MWRQVFNLPMALAGEKLPATKNLHLRCHHHNG
jgi:hypothetical protein